ncbi:MAG: hypothetical protein CO118_09505 [Flavobacteriales bacterium CG_4_9_14_3_um_filter_32_8]|nr:MAG: hypothetical protein CO118_09505 [Flavobacteriales bacterium CG_4_9_14_3_um_filter_32_8]
MIVKKLSIIIILIFGVSKIHANCTTGVAPQTPIVDSISVDLAGNVTICWQPIADPDLVMYYINYENPLNPGESITLDSVLAGTNCYVIPTGFNNSDIESVEFGVYARDACLLLSPPGDNYTNTIYLSNTFDLCVPSITLNWNSYDDFTSGTNVLYKVYVSENAGPFILIGTSLTTIFTFLSINQGSIYNFFVMAVENGGVGPFTSSSNDITLNTNTFYINPTFNYLYAATVVDSEQINLQFYVDTAADITSYRIKRAVSVSGPYTTVGSVSAYPNMNPLVQFVDESDVDANSTYYFYQVEAINSCGTVKFTSNIGRTIWLKVKSDGIIGTNTLTITQYDGWLGNVQKYEIYRAVAGIWESSAIATIASFSDSTIFIDDISQVLEGNGEFCYKIIATENPVPHVGSLPQATSISNESCAMHEPLIYVPNAFAPMGIYNVAFKPILTYPDPTSYLLQIYNKWGQKIFETKDLNEAWNGRVNNSGKMCQVDSYVYVILFQSASGEEFSKRGVVTLIN